MNQQMNQQMNRKYRTNVTLIGSLIFLMVSSLYSCGKKSDNIKVITYQDQVPILVNKDNNPTLRIEIVPIKSQHETINEVSVDLEGSNGLKDIQTVRLFSTGTKKEFFGGKQFGSEQQPASKVVFRDKLSVSDTLNLWVSIQLKDKVNLLQKLSVSCESINTDGERIKPESSDSKELRLGNSLRKHMDNGVDTYRIPGLTTTKNGTLLAIYDVRWDSYKDVQGNIDVGLSRSTDGGNSWEPMKIIMDKGEFGQLPEKFNGVGDAQILVDKNTNNIFVAGLWMHGVLNKDGKWIKGLTEESDAWNHQWKNKGSQPGFGVKQTSQFIISKSTDDGKTWSKPVNLTHKLKNKEWWLLAPAPGHGITLNDGTLIFTTQGRDEKGYPFSNITWSKDNGETWHTSNAAYHNTTESMAVQLSDGSIMLNMRHNDNKNNNSDTNGRAVAVTHDLGKTWTEHPTSRNALIEPRAMASLHKHKYTENGKEKSVLLFSNPNSKTIRHQITIKVSFDEGKTWPEKYWTLLDDQKSKGYSCLTSIDENTIGILYEGSQADITFQKIALSDLLKKNN